MPKSTARKPSRQPNYQPHGDSVVITIEIHTGGSCGDVCPKCKKGKCPRVDHHEAMHIDLCYCPGCGHAWNKKKEEEKQERLKKEVEKRKKK
jgi:hypothetical protein